MGHKIELTDEQVNELASFYQGKIDELYNEVAKYKELINQLTGGISERKTAAHTGMVRTKFNKKKYTWRSICREILEEYDRPMTTEELYEEIAIKDPSIEERDRDNVRASLAGSLSTNVKKGNFASFKNPTAAGNMWAMPYMVENDYPRDAYIQKLNDAGFNIRPKKGIKIKLRRKADIDNEELFGRDEPKVEMPFKIDDGN